MFCQPPDEDTQKSKSCTSNKKNRKAKKKNKNKLKRETKKKQLKFANTMSAWAENFAVAATWQLKHQVAYWKARAKALEYENKVLHDVIHRNNLVVRSNSQTEKRNGLQTETDHDNSEAESSSAEEHNVTDEENEEIQSDEDFEVSEEFIQFLTANAKYKEDARKERERLKAKEEESDDILIEERETCEENRERMKELYGDRWQRISALEMSLLTSFIHDSDQCKPQLWPNIPFNFNCS